MAKINVKTVAIANGRESQMSVLPTPLRDIHLVSGYGLASMP